MQGSYRSILWAAGALMLAWAGAGQAQENAFDLSMPAQTYVRNAGSFMLAANETEALVKKQGAPAAMATPQPEFEPPLLTGGNAHMAFGLSTIALAGLTAMTAPEGCEHNCPTPAPPRETNGTHAKLAKATIAMAAATIASGLIVHWDDFHLEDGFADPDNLHVMLGVTGAALMAYAVNKSANSSTQTSHAGVAELGALGMVAAIKLTW
ncbi:MAG: hypothetical protein PHQ60_10470 [Sideroxydans sp.]|nr:hypothetical protein [Sideroxydans sp.]